MSMRVYIGYFKPPLVCYLLFSNLSYKGQNLMFWSCEYYLEGEKKKSRLSLNSTLM